MRRAVKSEEVETYESPSPDHRRFKLLVERDITGSKNLAAGMVILPPGASQPGTSRHPNTEEVYYMLKGKGTMKLGDEMIDLREGTVVYVPFDTEHQVFNASKKEELRFFWANTPPLGDYKPILENWKKVK